MRTRSEGLRGIKGVEWRVVAFTCVGPLMWQAMARWCLTPPAERD